MDFLNNATAQLRDLFGSMTPGARITAGLLLIVVVVSLGYLFLQHGYGPDAYLLNGQVFPAMQISSMQRAFGQAGLTGYQIENGQIRIPRGRSDVFMAALVEYDALPPKFGEALDKALATSGLWVDAKQREELLKAAKQKELSQVISAMKQSGIHSAMVLVDMKTKSGFLKEEMYTASVNLELTGSEPIDPQRALLIRKLVAKSFAGMKTQDVVVTDSNGGIHGGSSDPSTPGGADENLHFVRKKSYQKDWEQKITKALRYVHGVIVTADVVLDLDRHYTKKEVTYDPKTVPFQSNSTTLSKTSDSVDPGGRPGYEAQQNQPMSLKTAQAKKINETVEESAEQITNMTPGTEVLSEKEGLTPKLVNVVVAVPSSHFRRVWDEQNPTPSGEEPKTPDPAMLEEIRTKQVADIENCVAQLLPLPLGVTDRTELVNVTVFQDIKPDEIPKAGISEKAMTWFGQSWSTIGLILLAGFSLLMLRSMIRSVPAPTPSPVISTSIEEEEAEQQTKTADRTERTDRTRTGRTGRTGQIQFNTTGASLRDELSDLVGEDPDAAANILRNWIGNIN